MPILRNEFNTVFTSILEINPLIAPCKIGSFKITPEAESIVKIPLDLEQSIKIYQYVPPDLDITFKQKGLKPSVAFSYWTGSDEKVHERINRSLNPHTNNKGNNEAHLLFSGSIIIYIDNGHGQYAVLMGCNQRSFLLTPHHW